MNALQKLRDLVAAPDFTVETATLSEEQVLALPEFKRECEAALKAAELLRRSAREAVVEDQDEYDKERRDTESKCDDADRTRRVACQLLERFGFDLAVQHPDDPDTARAAAEARADEDRRAELKAKLAKSDQTRAELDATITRDVAAGKSVEKYADALRVNEAESGALRRLVAEQEAKSQQSKTKATLMRADRLSARRAGVALEVNRLLSATGERLDELILLEEDLHRDEVALRRRTPQRPLPGPGEFLQHARRVLEALRSTR